MSEKAIKMPLAGMRQLVDGALRLSGGTALGYMITLAATPLIAKLYGPEAFGIWAGWLALAGVIGTVACLCYETAIALSNDDWDALYVAALAILLAVPASMLSGLLLIGAWLLGIPGPWQRLEAHTLWIPVGALIIAWVGVATQWLARDHQVGGLAKAKIWSSGVTATVQLGLGWVGGAGGLIIGDIVGRSAGLWGRIKKFWHEQAPHVAAIQRKDLRVVFYRYRVHSKWMTPTVLINTLGLQAPLLLMLAWYGGTIGGQFSLAQRLMALPVVLLGQSVSQVFYPMMAKAYKRSPHEALRLFLGLSSLLAIVGVILIGMVSCFDESWLIALLGREWEGVGQSLLPLSILSGIQLSVSTVSQTALVLGKQKWFSLWVIGAVSVNICAMWMGHNKTGADGAVWGLAMAGGSAYVFLWLSLLARLLYLKGKVVSTRETLI